MTDSLCPHKDGSGGAASTSAAAGGKPKAKAKEKRKSRRSFDPDASVKISGADAAKGQLRRGSLGALPSLGL